MSEDWRNSPKRLEGHAQIDAWLYQGYFWLACGTIILFTTLNMPAPWWLATVLVIAMAGCFTRFAIILMNPPRPKP